MPGFHGSKLAYHPELHMLAHPARMMGGGMRQGGKMQPMVHPMFDALRSRHQQERSDYIHMMKNRERRKAGVEGGYPTFDSLKLLGADNDDYYLDAFMSENMKYRHPSDESDPKLRSRSSSHASKSSSKRNSLNVSDIKNTILGSMRSSASDENLYESVEVIQYRKHIEAISRQNKISTVSKTGHPLFDHLRVEKVLKPRCGPQQNNKNNNNNRNSDGGSNSQSSSGSGDEFNYVRKPNTRFSRREVLQTTHEGHPKSHPKQGRPQKQPARHVPDAGSESDDDWLIPRPKVLGGGARSRRTGAFMRSTSHDESDSSSKSTGLR